MATHYRSVPNMDMPQKMKDAYIQRMNPKLKEKYLALPAEEQAAILRSLVRFHQVIEEETFALLEGILNAKAQEK